MIEVSLYIPCFNAAKTIGLCLDTAFEQTYPLKEVVVVDDGSTDETVAIVSRYPVRIIKHNDNRGLAVARNTAIKNIDTEFVASLDADCLPKPNWLARLMKRLNSPKIAGVGGKLSETYSSNIFAFWRLTHMKQYWEEENAVPPFLFGSNTVFCKEALINIGLYNENYRNNYEDVDLSNRLKKAGYALVYESRAIVHHLKEDNICSILNRYWRWNLGYYQKKEYYSNLKNFVYKIKDNIGLANRYIEEDLSFNRRRLVYLDFLLALHHSLRDLGYFISQGNREGPDIANNSILSSWIVLLDLTFFYHFDSQKNTLSTLAPHTYAFLQNLFALDLILGKFIRGAFKNKNFKKILYKHLFLSIYGISDNYLLDRLSNLIELHQDWDGLIKKKQPNLLVPFLENFSLAFKKWLENLIFHFPDIVQQIEISAEKTDSFILKSEVCKNEDK